MSQQAFVFHASLLLLLLSVSTGHFYAVNDLAFVSNAGSLLLH